MAFGSRPPSTAICIIFMHCWPRVAVNPPPEDCLGEVPLALLSRERCDVSPHEPQLVATRDGGAEEAQAILPTFDVEYRKGLAVHGEDVADETAIVRVVTEERICPTTPDDSHHTGCPSGIC